MQFIWLSCSLLIGSILELLLGCQGWIVPLLSLVAFHFGAMRHYWKVLLTACFFGVWLDLSLGRSFPIHLIIIPVTIGLARLWRRQQLTYMLSLQMIPGLITGLTIGLIYGLSWLRDFHIENWLDYRSFLWLVMSSGLWSALAFPLLCKVLEWGCFRLDLPRYSQIGADYLSASSSDDMMEVLDGED